MMITLILALLTAGLAACEATTGGTDAVVSGPIGIAILGLVLVGFELLVSQFLTFVIICVVAYFLWLRLCRPSSCRVLQDLEWCLAWGNVLLALVAIVCWHIGILTALLLWVNHGLRSLMLRRGCMPLDPFSVPWLR